MKNMAISTTMGPGFKVDMTLIKKVHRRLTPFGNKNGSSGPFLAMDWEFESKTAGGETLNDACSDAFFGSAFHCEDFGQIFKQPLT